MTGFEAGAVPESTDTIVGRANDLLDRRRIDIARGMLRDVLAAEPDHIEALLCAARAEVMADQNTRALDFLQRLLLNHPGHQGGRFMLFGIEMEEGRHQQAEDIILGLLHESPAEAVYYAFYARLMLRTLHFDKASQLADEAVRYAPDRDTCLQAKALCDIANGRTGAQSQALMRLLARNPDDMHTLRLVVVALYHANRTKDALRLSQELLRAQPNDPRLLAIVKELQQVMHWSLLPMWPARRWGYAGAGAMWFGMMIIAQLLGRLAPDYRSTFMTGWLVFVIYSWVWPPLLKRWYERA